METSISGTNVQIPAPKGRRFAAAIVDLFVIPILLGVLLAFVLIAVPEGIRTILLVVVNIGWLLFRDTVYSPGRAMMKLKLISLSGQGVSVAQAFIRNILLMIPFILVLGYVVELIAILARGNRVADGWAKTQVVQA